ncbi:hypothetical protein GLYMA_20G117700v4 [Glycine max]|uniref:Uncharacterized protein n=1 Tax=Glycine max TaxID=3847 RepID=A0A0R0EBH7_SOYBN|nr:hypothetical protein GLYMA_20G117700v4 [Glycine max]
MHCSRFNPCYVDITFKISHTQCISLHASCLGASSFVIIAQMSVFKLIVSSFACLFELSLFHYFCCC